MSNIDKYYNDNICTSVWDKCEREKNLWSMYDLEYKE